MENTVLTFSSHAPSHLSRQLAGGKKRWSVNHFHKDNLRHLPRFPDFFVTVPTLNPRTCDGNEVGDGFNGEAYKR